jgi:hypothetical protein
VRTPRRAGPRRSLRRNGRTHATAGGQFGGKKTRHVSETTTAESRAVVRTTLVEAGGGGGEGEVGGARGGGLVGLAAAVRAGVRHRRR